MLYLFSKMLIISPPLYFPISPSPPFSFFHILTIYLMFKVLVLLSLSVVLYSLVPLRTKTECKQALPCLLTTPDNTEFVNVIVIVSLSVCLSPSVYCLSASLSLSLSLSLHERIYENIKLSRRKTVNYKGHHAATI